MDSQPSRKCSEWKELPDPGRKQEEDFGGFPDSTPEEPHDDLATER
jgi:hypothetical protein